jgi:hypothetical protein
VSGTSDVNWRSYVGPQDNGKLITSEDWQAPVNPRDYDDLFKCSNVDGLTVRGLTIPASREDSVDCVRGNAYSFQSCTFQGSITVKGGIDGYELVNCVISGTVEYGQYDNYWKWGRKPTRSLPMTACCSPDGSPVRVKLWDAEMPRIEGTNVKITRIPKWIWLPYFIFRRLTNPKAV